MKIPIKEVREALARGYNDLQNKEKEIDTVLMHSMANQILHLIHDETLREEDIIIEDVDFNHDELKINLDILTQIQAEHKDWHKHNFGEVPFWMPVFGMMEELGELAHALLKQVQGVRTTEDHNENIKDAIGDLLIFTIGLANTLDLDLRSVIAETWGKVKIRDWKKYPETGMPKKISFFTDDSKLKHTLNRTKTLNQSEEEIMADYRKSGKWPSDEKLIDDPLDMDLLKNVNLCNTCTDDFTTCISLNTFHPIKDIVIKCDSYKKEE